jgi:hypothetical protein
MKTLIFSAIILTSSASVFSAETWTEVKRFSGKGPQRTADFTVTSDTWRIRYVLSGIDPEIGKCLFIVNTKGPDEFLAFSETTGGRGETNGKKRGTYWLEINAALCNWHLLIEEKK